MLETRAGRTVGDQLSRIQPEPLIEGSTRPPAESVVGSGALGYRARVERGGALHERVRWARAALRDRVRMFGAAAQNEVVPSPPLIRLSRRTKWVEPSSG